MSLERVVVGTEVVGADAEAREVDDDGDRELGDFVAVSRTLTMDGIGGTELRSSLREALKGLNPDLVNIVRLRFGLDGGDELTQAEIARRMGVSREWVRQLELRAMRKLAARMDMAAMRDFLY